MAEPLTADEALDVLATLCERIDKAASSSLTPEDDLAVVVIPKPLWDPVLATRILFAQRLAAIDTKP